MGQVHLPFFFLNVCHYLLLNAEKEGGGLIRDISSSLMCVLKELQYQTSHYLKSDVLYLLRAASPSSVLP